MKYKTLLIYRWVVALFTTVLCFAGQITALQKEGNLYFRIWDHSDSLVLLADVLLLSFLAVGLSIVVDKTGIKWLKKVFHHVFLLILGAAILSNIPFDYWDRHPSRWKLAWLILMGGVWVSLVHPRTRLVRVVRTFCLIFSPLIVMILAPMITWKSWGAPQTAIPRVDGPSSPASPVFFFVFDEWSYTRSTKDGQFLEDLPNLRRLAKNAVSFSKAQSPAAITYRSVPMTLFQTVHYEEIPRGIVRQYEFERFPGEFDPEIGPDEAKYEVQPVESLLSTARKNGQHSYLLGFYLPYGKLVGDQADWCRSYEYYSKGHNLPERLALGVFENIRYWQDPFSRAKWRTMQARVYSDHWVEVHQKMRQDINDLIDKTPDNSFVFIHFPLPHGPFVFEADGSYLGPYRVEGDEDDKKDRITGTPEEYHRHLRYLDLLIGQVLDRLEEAGKLDKSMLIMTSDHSWRIDTDQRFLDGNKPPFRVPLLIKLPFQKEGLVVDRPIRTTHLRPLISKVFQGYMNGKTTDYLLEKIKSGSAP